MRIVLRADASHMIGSGHVMRCLALAQQLRTLGATVEFISRDGPGNLNGLIRDAGFALHTLPSPVPLDIVADSAATLACLQFGARVDWLIVDHYGLDATWERAVAPHVGRLGVIDDLSDRMHQCDLLIDQNMQPQYNRYQGLVPDACRQLLGPSYALLRDEFRQARKRATFRDGTVKHILVSFGGSDPTNETEKVLKALSHLSGVYNVTVILGAANPQAERLQSQTQNGHVQILTAVQNMAEHLLRADLAIGAGGISTWERCCLGVPSVVVNVADNQMPISQALHTLGAVHNLGFHSQVTEVMLAAQIADVLGQPEWLRQMSEIAFHLVDGLGTERVATAIMSWQ